MKKLTTPILMAYGGLAIPLAALGLPLVVYLPPFYAGPVGLGVGTVGIISVSYTHLTLPTKA